MKEIQQIPEKRMVKRLFDYMEKISEENGVADYRKFSSEAIAEIWPQCFLLSVGNSSMETKNFIYKFEYVGDIIKEAFGKNPTGELINLNIKDTPGIKIIENIDICTKELKQLHESGKFVNKKNKVIKYRSCMAPFGKSGSPATNIIVGLSWQSY